VISAINTSYISDKKSLELIVQEYIRISAVIWYKFLCCINITKHSKAWWNKECQTELANYRSSKKINDWKAFKEVIKKSNEYFLMTRFIKLHQKTKDLGTL